MSLDPLTSRVSTAGQPVALFVSSSGGVLLDLLALEEKLEGFSIVWAVVKADDTASALAGRAVHWIPDISLKDPRRLAVSFLSARRVIGQCQPELIVSAGSGPAFPFFALAKLKRIPSFWISTLNIHDREGLTARLCAGIASRIFVQQRSLLRETRRGIFIGELY